MFNFNSGFKTSPPFIIDPPPGYMLRAAEYLNNNPSEMVRIAEEYARNPNISFPCAPNDPDCPSGPPPFRDVPDNALRFCKFKWSLIFVGPAITGPLSARVFLITEFRTAQNDDIIYILGYDSTNPTVQVYYPTSVIWVLFC